jgi:AraC-like DNA-binding protein
MYIITDQLKDIGFSVNRLDHIIKRNNNKKKLNTLEFYCIYIILKDIRMTVENITHTIESSNMVFIGPQKSIEFETTRGHDVLIITFSSSFYERSVKDSLFLNSQLFFNDNSDIFIAPFVNKEEMRIVFMDRMENFRKKDRSLFISAAHNAIERLILDAFLYIPTQEVRKDVKFDYLYCVNRFKIILQRDYKTSKKVSHYASELNITPRKLTEMTEYILGKTAKHVIIEKLINESKKLLSYSNYTISQIAYELGFSDEGNFTNFFKKHTQKNPSEMRNN